VELAHLHSEHINSENYNGINIIQELHVKLHKQNNKSRTNSIKTNYGKAHKKIEQKIKFVFDDL